MEDNYSGHNQYTDGSIDSDGYYQLFGTRPILNIEDDGIVADYSHGERYLVTIV